MKAESAALLLRVVLQEGANELNEARAQLASTNPLNWRRGLLQEPKRSAKTIPLRDTYAASQVPTVTRTNDLDCIAPESSSGSPAALGGASVHPVARAQYRPSTPDRATTLKLLRSVPAPLTTTRVARALVWTEERARYWLSYFASKGVLVVSRDGHSWSGK